MEYRRYLLALLKPMAGLLFLQKRLCHPRHTPVTQQRHLRPGFEALVPSINTGPASRHLVEEIASGALTRCLQWQSPQVRSCQPPLRLLSPRHRLAARAGKHPRAPPPRLCWPLWLGEGRVRGRLPAACAPLRSETPAGQGLRVRARVRDRSETPARHCGSPIVHLLGLLRHF